MREEPVLRLRKGLRGDEKAGAPPPGVCFVAYDPPRHGPAARRLLNHAFATGWGEVRAFEGWRREIEADPEYDHDLLFTAVSQTDGALAGFAHCWTSAFLKDLAVAPDWRRRGVAKALIDRACAAFAARGAAHLDLKVMAANRGALIFYERLGFTVAQPPPVQYP